MSHTTIQLLRVLHIVGAAWWLGSLLFFALILLPTLRAIGPASGQVMQQMVEVRKLPLYMAIIPMITVFAGIALYWNDSAGFRGDWMHSGPGRMFGMGAGFALIVMVIGMAVSAPSGKRLGALGASIRTRGTPPTPEEQAEVQRLQKRLAGAAQISVILLLVAAVAMSVARYMPN